MAFGCSTATTAITGITGFSSGSIATTATAATTPEGRWILRSAPQPVVLGGILTLNAMSPNSAIVFSIATNWDTYIAGTGQPDLALFTPLDDQIIPQDQEVLIPVQAQSIAIAWTGHADGDSITVNWGYNYASITKF